MVALSVVVPPTVILPVEGATVTVETGMAVTVTVAFPVLPSLVAVIVVLPGPTPVTTPLEETVAMPLLPEVQVTARPFSNVPNESLVVADSVVVPPTKMFALDG